MANKRGARYVSADDLIFLIRHDRGKVNRLRTYLSWKDVRKHAKDSGGGDGGNVEVDALEEGGENTYNLVSEYSLHWFRKAHCEGPENHDQTSLGDWYYLL